MLYATLPPLFSRSVKGKVSSPRTMSPFNRAILPGNIFFDMDSIDAW